MISWVIRQCNRLPPPWNFVSFLALIALLGVVVVGLFSGVRSCGYDKARQEYEVRDQAHEQERNRLVARAEAAEGRVAELEPKVLAYEAMAESGKKVDGALAQKIEQVSKEAADEEARAEVNVDCHTRADRVCALFRANGLAVDCGGVHRKCGPG